MDRVMVLILRLLFHFRAFHRQTQLPMDAADVKEIINFRD